MYEKKFMEEAIRLAVENVKKGAGGPFGAVVVKDGKVVAASANTVTPDNDPTAHAEVNAIRQACRRLGSFQLAGCEIYCSCEPCPMCLGAIYWARPDKVYYACTKTDAMIRLYTGKLRCRRQSGVFLSVISGKKRPEKSSGCGERKKIRRYIEKTEVKPLFFLSFIK